MKWLIIFLLGSFTILRLSAQDATPAQGPVITWEFLSHDFGDIVQGDKVDYTFKFTNTGNQPLVLTNVEVTCGCTTPKGWPRDPVMPGGKGELTIAFNSVGKFGKQNKVVTVTSNSVGSSNQVMITANVLEKSNPN
ncbi:MAG: DUF1573 domain-containing protein [Cyclobacteriaceae bacterium]|jgi:hypothetical protein|nr:DUF1573 domain-containing protein [Cyclobacteriaceae bacterium]